MSDNFGDRVTYITQVSLTKISGKHIIEYPMVVDMFTYQFSLNRIIHKRVL